MLTRSYFYSRNQKQTVVALSETTKAKKKKRTNMGEDVDKLQSSQIVGGNVSDAATVEKSLVVPHELNTELSDDPAIPLFGI